jgi:phage tail sheath protein FI
MLLHCAQQGNRFAILDSLPGAAPEAVMNQGRQLVLGQQEPLNGALYYPWVITQTNPDPVPPCGHVAGIYGRSDSKIGVFKAPANEEIFGVLDLEIQIDNGVQDKLNPARVNCLRAFPGRGIRVWGARTLGSVPGDLKWLYVNVRRLFLTVRRWIDLNMVWATFEPNDPRLWVRIQRELTTFLAKLQRDGALQGATPGEAFYIKCDAENNPPEIRDVGQVIIEIGLAPLAPAEFIVVRIVRLAGGTPDN